MVLRLPWIWLPLVGPIRVTTVLTAVVMVVAILWRRRAPVAALIALMAWLSAYEILFEATGTAVHGWSPSYFLWMSAAVSGWVVLAYVGGITPNPLVLLAAALVWVLWLATGFNTNSPTAAGTPGFNISAEIFNELSKMLLGASYLAGSLSLRPQQLR